MVCHQESGFLDVRREEVIRLGHSWPRKPKGGRSMLPYRRGSTIILPALRRQVWSRLLSRRLLYRE
jgi:hypothetical protein